MFRKFLRSFPRHSTSASQASGRSRQRCRPRFEELEDRRLLSTFTSPIPFGVGAQSTADVVVADFTGDHTPDLAVTSSNGTVTILAGASGVGLVPTPVSTVAVPGAYKLAVGNFNNDQAPDLVVTNTTGVTVLLNDGHGHMSLAPPVGTSSAVNGVVAVVVADFNKDGKMDIAFSNHLDSKVTRLDGNGDGTFRVWGFVGSPTLTPDSIGLTAGDFNHDGLADLAVASADPANKVLVLLSNTQLGGFQQSGPYAVGRDPFSMTTADVNGDGNLDLVTANQFDNTVSVLLGKADGTFQSAGTLAVGFSPKAAAVGDFNLDGKPDLAVANNGGVTLLQGDGTGNFVPDPGSPVAGAGASLAVAVGDFNHDGVPDLVEGNYNQANVQLMLNATLLNTNGQQPPQPIPVEPQAAIPTHFLRGKVTRNGNTAQQTLSLTNASGHAVQGAITVLIEKLGKRVKLLSAKASTGNSHGHAAHAQAVAIVPGLDPSSKLLQVTGGVEEAFSNGGTIRLQLKFRTPGGRKPSYVAEVLGAEAQGGNG